MSNEHIEFLNKLKRKNIIIKIIQFSLLLFFFLSWELLSINNIIDSFIFSSPIKVISTISKLISDNNLFIHIFITLKEIIISFSLSTIIAFIFSLILYNYKIIKKILDPFITLFNSIPKVAFGPLIIIWIGANQKGIIFTSILISLITTLLTMLSGFENTDKDKIKLFKVLKANRIDLLRYLIIPSSIKNIITALKLNLSLSLIGVITGEFLSCKKGIGYLILYGTQVFNLSLVMSGIFLLLIVSFLFYLVINYFDKKINQ